MQKADMPIPRLFFSVSTVDNQLYAIGGMLAETVEQFAPIGLSVAALDRFLTIWGEIKKTN